MSGFYNPSTDETLGPEWLIDAELGAIVLDSATKTFAVVMAGAASKVSQSVAAYAQAVSGSGVFGCEVYSAPYVGAIPATTDTDYPGTDSGSDFTSPTNGNAAWLTQAGGAATYASVSPGADDVTYLRNQNQIEGPTPARLLLRGANATPLAGVRVLSVEVHARVKSTLTTTPVAAGCLNLAGTDYVAVNAAVPVNVGYSDMTIGLWSLNPATGLPWTLAQVNNLIGAGSTDEFGALFTWNASYTTAYADTIRISSVYLRVRWQPEDRLGYASGLVNATGWQEWTAKSVPNLLTQQDSNLEVNTANTGSWVADANTTLTNDTDDPAGGWTRSLKSLSGAAGAFGATSRFYPCIATKTYMIRCYAKVTSGRTTVLSLLFYDANGNLLQTSSSAGDVGTGAYAAIGMTAPVTAPTGATQFKARISTTATAGAQTCFATGLFVGLDQAAKSYVQTTYAGALADIKVDGSIEYSHLPHPLNELRVFRRISGTGGMSLPQMPPGSSAVGMPLHMSSYRPTLQDAAGSLLTLNANAGEVTAFVSTSLHNYDAANGPIAAYSQPYARRIPGAVYTGNTIQTELTLPAKTYVAFRLVVAAQVDPPAAALSIALKRRSDNVQAGGTASIGVTDLVQIIPPGGGPASRTTPQVFVVAIPTPAANTATQYYVELSSAAAAGSGWIVYALDDMGYSGDSVSADTIIFGAGVDAWTNPADGGENTHRNGMVTVQTKPSAPAGLAGSIVGTRVHLTWTATALGATFAATEIWRIDDRAGTADALGFVQIADLTTEANAAYNDPESRRGVPASYKIRTRRTDGSFSDFSGTVGPLMTPVTGFDLLLVSAEAPLGSYVGAMSLDSPLVFSPPVERVVKEFAGRDGAVAFLPIEDPLDEWDRDVALYWTGNTLAGCSLTDPSIAGRVAFNALEALSRMSLSYVCVLDWDGNRWFANVAVNELRRGVHDDDEGGYLASIHVRELTRVPSTPTASA